MGKRSNFERNVRVGASQARITRVTRNHIVRR